MRRLMLWFLVTFIISVTLATGGVVLLPSLEVPGVSGNIDCAAVPNTRSALWYDTLAFKTKSCENGVVVALSDVTAPGTGITSLNTLAGVTQTFATGTAGTTFNISSVGTVHTFNIPFANPANTVGLVSNASQTFGGAKTFSNAAVFSAGLTGTLTGSASDLACASCVSISELTFDPATQAELDAHTTATAAHGATGAVVGTTNTQTLQNKTLDNSTIVTLRDDRLFLQDNLDNTKTAVLQLSGIPTGTSRIITIPGSDNSLTVMPKACASTDKFRELLPDGTFVCAADTGGAGGSGITTLNTLTDLSQTFAIGVNGTDFNISSATGVHTFNIPTASAVNRGLTTLGTSSSSAAAGDDNRLSAMQTPSALSNASQITCTKPTQYIAGSGAPVTLTDAKWLVDGTFNGQSCEICGSHATFTVTAPSTATIKLNGGTGSVVFGDAYPCQKFAWTGATWRQSGAVTLQQAANGGNIIDLAGTQLRLRDGTSGFDFKVTAGIPTAQGICAGGDCDHINFIPAGKSAILQGNGVEFERITVAGVHTYSGAARPRGTLYWDAGAIKPDGTQCVPVTAVINAGPVIDGITCADNAAAKLSVKVRLPDRFTGSDLYCRLVAHDLDAGQVLAWDARAQCRTPGVDVINATWSTPANVDITMTTANIPYSSPEVTITPNGGCLGGDMMFLEFNMDATTNTDDGDAVIEALTCEYLQGSRGD